MKKGYIKILIFEILLLSILALNSFISNILRGYNIVILLIISVIIFKLLFGYEKDKHRYVKDTIFDMLITLLIAFLAYYVLGIFIGFVRVDSYYNVYGITTYVLPLILTITLKEVLRYMIITKSEGSKMLLVTTCILFAIVDISTMMSYAAFDNNYNTFLFIALTVLPAISTNIVATYVCKKLGFKPNMVWLLIINMYQYLLPIVPDTGDYILSIIRFIFPIIIGYRVFIFFEKEADKQVDRDYNKINKLSLGIVTVIIITLVYFTSGYFHYHAVSIASGSMHPNINKGDVVVIEKIDKDFKQLKKGMVLAYRHDGVTVVHRLINIVHEDNKYYFYTKGDANSDPDSIVITEKMVVGKVNLKIPFIGWPTVWVNEL